MGNMNMNMLSFAAVVCYVVWLYFPDSLLPTCQKAQTRGLSFIIV